MSDQQAKRYLTAEEFAKRLQEAGIRCTERTVLNWIKLGKVKAIRPGRRQFYIPVEELERILKSDRLTLRLATA
ncbi:MAG: helix-turn-helix domain-containing protein [Roseiflexus sp.]|nr:helix-turn-helix domain-containing protein [Roseiflexus sp.]